MSEIRVGRMGRPVRYGTKGGTGDSCNRELYFFSFPFSVSCGFHVWACTCFKRVEGWIAFPESESLEKVVVRDGKGRPPRRMWWHARFDTGTSLGANDKSRYGYGHVTVAGWIKLFFREGEFI